MPICIVASPATNDVDAYDAIDSSNIEQLPQTSNTDADSESMEENLPPSRSESTETTETTVDEDDIRIKLKYINDDRSIVFSSILHCFQLYQLFYSTV